MLATSAHAAGRATVRGANGVNVREAPSLDSPAFVVLTKGRVVTVQKVTGAWALITLDSGRQGYVKAALLDLPAGIEVVAAATLSAPRPPAAVVTPQPTETVARPPADTPEAHAEGGRRDALEHEVAQLRERLAALESAVVATPAEAATPAERASADEPVRGGGAPPAERDPTRPPAPSMPGAAPPVEGQEIGPSLALAGVGLVFGFLIGAAYGRRQERNRRTRVRF